METQTNYRCANCNYQKLSTKSPNQMRRCPYCGKESMGIDKLTTQTLVQEADGID